MSIDRKISPVDTSSQKPKNIYFWLDILGFSNGLNDENRYEDLYNKLLEFRNHISSNCSDLPVTTQIISDGMVVRLEDNSIESFITLIKVIKQLLLKMMEINIFVRGSIALGTCISVGTENNEDKLLGNGLAKAVKIEGNDVCWPVVGTTENEYECILKYYDRNVNLDNLKTYFIKCKNDNKAEIYVINVFDRIPEKSKVGIFKSIADKYTKFKAFKEIEKGVEENENFNHRVFSKYQWLVMLFRASNPEFYKRQIETRGDLL